MTLFTLWDRRAFISSRSIVQLTNVIPSSSSKSNINGHTVRLQKTNHSTASLMRNLHTPDFVSLHDSVLFWLTPNNVAASVTFFLANTKSVWRKGIHIIVHLLVLDRIRSKRSKARREKLFLVIFLIILYIIHFSRFIDCLFNLARLCKTLAGNLVSTTEFKT